MKCLAVDVGGTFIKYAVVDESEKIVACHKLPTPLDCMEHYLDALHGVYKRHKGQIDGIAMSVPGILDADTGYMYTGGSLRFIRQINVARMISERCDNIPVSMENDAKCAALAELDSGVLRHVTDAVVILNGTGIGGCVITNRKIHKGKHAFAGEFSYISKRYGTDGARLSWAAQCGTPALYALMHERTGEPLESVNGEMLFARVEAGDPIALDVLDVFCQRMAIWIYNLQCVVDPELFAIGGGISAQPVYIQTLRRQVERIASQGLYEGFPVPVLVDCKYHNEANLLGSYYWFKHKYADKA